MPSEQAEIEELLRAKTLEFGGGESPAPEGAGENALNPEISKDRLYSFKIFER